MDNERLIAAICRPLVWHHYDVWTWWAECPSGTYHVEERNGGWRVQLRVGGLVHDVQTTEDTTPEDLAAAQAAADADYRATLASALDLDKIGRLVEALEPFKVMSAEMFARNWNQGDIAIQLGTAHSPHRLTFGDFLELHAALADLEGAK